MNGVVDAVKYGIEILKISPEEMFSLFKVAHTEGDADLGENYPLWLAKEILKIAERENVGYSQLMVKKFAITQTILESKEAVIKGTYIDMFKKNLSGSIYSEGYSEFGGVELEVDWEKGMDYDEDNAFFFETLPEELRQDIKSNNKVSLMVRLSMDPCAKGTELVQDAKARSVQVKTKGGAFLYRMCLLSDMFFELGSNFRVCFLVNTDFLTSEVNDDVLRYFLRYFKYKGLVIPSSELFEDYSVGGSFAFMVCSPRTVGDKSIDSIVLKDTSGTVLRYSRSKLKFREFLEINSGDKNTENVEYFLSTNRLSVGNSGNIACLRGMLEYYVSYFGIVSSLTHFGFSGEIPVVVTGDSRYKNLLGNCIPLFIFDSENKLCLYQKDGYKGLKKDLTKMYENYKVYFSYEAKELVSVGKAILEKGKESGVDTTGKSINEIRQELNNQDLNTAYLEALNNLKGYIKTSYREMQ